MTIQNFKYPGLILASLLALTGCPSDDTGGSGSDTDQTTGPSSSSATSPSTSATTPSTSATEPTTMPDTETGTDTTESETDPSTSTGPDPTVFMFRDDPPEDYTQIDRMGLPAVNTALIATDNKDAYNADDPTARAGGDYDNDIEDSIETLHEGIPGMQTPGNTGLDDDLLAIPLVPCTVGLASTCEAQIGPFLAAGDQIPVNTEEAAGFPNGRRPQDPVIDILLGVLLLQVQPPPGQTGGEFAAIPLNPAANDVAFLEAFPYFAPPN